MRPLLGTHTFIWYDAGDPKLGPTARRLITDGANDVFVRVATFWEMAIKASMGRLDLRAPVDVLMFEAPRQNRLVVLPIAPAHLAALRRLRLPFHHLDPFDRMLVAQARAEAPTLESRDTVLGAYDVRRAW